MNCLDCTLAGATTPAVATCHSCGAAVCADHAVIQPHHLQRVVPLNRLVPIEPPARVIACEVCAAAQNAAQHAEPAHRPMFRRRHAPPAIPSSLALADAEPAASTTGSKSQFPATAGRHR
jgi:hypothetical protein